MLLNPSCWYFRNWWSRTSHWCQSQFWSGWATLPGWHLYNNSYQIRMDGMCLRGKLEARNQLAIQFLKH